MYKKLFLKNRQKIAWLLSLLLIAPFFAFAQSGITLNIKDVPLKTALETVSSQSNFKFVYTNELNINSYRVTVNSKNESATVLFDKIFKPISISYKIKGNQVVLGITETPQQEQIPQTNKQHFAVNGSVRDNLGASIIGAYVLVKGTKSGASTDVDGNYQINVPQSGVLVFSYMGYKTIETPVNNRSKIDVVMQEDAALLKDVVVTAMGIKKEKKALGYAVQDIKSDEILKNKSSNAINSLSGRIAGVNITQSGGAAGSGANIVIRGGTSLERDNQPLFVVDGLIYDNGTNVAGTSGFDGMLRTTTSNNDRAMDINPEDIESISVLKGPAAAALYGSKAAAGVILITTKKGKSGVVQVNVNSKYSYSWVNRYPAEQNGYNRGEYNSDGSVNTAQIMTSWGEPVKADETLYNNIKDFFNHSKVWDNSVSISGGNDRGTFYLSCSRYDQDGIIPKTGYDKSTFRFNGDQKYGKLSVGINAAYSVSHTRKTLTSDGLFNSGGTGAMVSLYGWPKSENIKKYLNDDGSKYRMFPAEDLSSDIENPYWIVNKDKLNDKTNRFTGSINITYNLSNFINLAYRLGYDSYTTRDRAFIYPGSAVRETFQNGKLSENDDTHEYLSSNLMLNFHKTYGDFDLNLLTGMQAEDTKTNIERRNGWNFVTPGVFSFENIATANKQLQSVHSDKRLMGIYGELRASYKNFAYITATGRNDWSSTLPKDSRSYFYPSISGAFIFTEVLPKVEWLSFGKIRASWAEVGKDTDPYVTNTYLWAPRQDLAGISAGNSWTRGNPNLKPEKTRSWEAGLEMKFFDGRLGIDYTYYRNKSFNQIIVPRLSQATGYIFLSINCGQVTNKGMELSINGTPIAKTDFTWDVTLNLSGNRGTVNGLLKGQTVLYITQVQVGNAKAASFSGGDFMGISGSKWNRSLDGSIVVDKNTGLPVSGSDATLQVGNREPKFQGGLNNSFQWKNWNLSFLLELRVGGDIFNGTDYYMTNMGMSKRSMGRKSITIKGKYVTGKDGNDKNTYSDFITTTYEAGKNYVINGKSLSGESIIRDYYTKILPGETSSYMTKTNWLRLRSVTLSYDFKNLIKNIKFIKGATATISGNNLFLLTNYHGMDPETSAAGSGVEGSSSVGIDYCGVPSTAGMSLGVNLTF